MATGYRRWETREIAGPQTVLCSVATSYYVPGEWEDVANTPIGGAGLADAAHGFNALTFADEATALDHFRGIFPPWCRHGWAVGRIDCTPISSPSGSLGYIRVSAATLEALWVYDCGSALAAALAATYGITPATL